MNLAEILQQHLLLCEDMHLLFLEENRLLQTTRRPPGEHFLARKRDLLPRLDAARCALSTSQGTAPREGSSEKASVVRLQKKMLSLLLLDRENEKLLLQCSVQTDGPRAAAKPRPHLVTRAYFAAAAA